jgi:hypothetical protein
MNYMFNQATSFKQNLCWSLEGLTSFDDMFFGSKGCVQAACVRSLVALPQIFYCAMSNLTNAPTSFPTSHPATLPTLFPMSYPTSFPTSNSTKVPTSFHSSNPAQVPTLFPTSDPPSFNTSNYSKVPTPFHSSNPTQVPTLFPTSDPPSSLTSNSSKVPTSLPTIMPTSFQGPTQAPLPCTNQDNNACAPSPCAKGTKDLGYHDGYIKGNQQTLRLCAIPGFRSSSAESTRTSLFYIKNSGGNVIMNANMSGNALALFKAGKASGLRFSARSSFRSMEHQEQLCKANAKCRRGIHTFVAQPGYSNHQLGDAIDFAGIDHRRRGGTRNCTQRATDPDSKVWSWLKEHAAEFGFRQYSAESWHWDGSGMSNRC